MKKRVFIICIFMGLLLVSAVLATTTTINVKTFPNHDTILKTLNPYPKEGESNVLEYFEGVTDDSGDVSFESRTSESVINIVIIVEKDGVRKKINDKTLHMFTNKYTGGIINLEVKEKTPEPVITANETEVENATGELINNETEIEATADNIGETEITEELVEETKEAGKLTGFVIDTGKEIVTSKITYFVVGIVIALGIVLIVRKKLKSKKGGTYLDFKVTEKDNPKILDAEKKIREAKEELDEIKNRKSKLEEVKKRFEKDKKELEELEKD